MNIWDSIKTTENKPNEPQKSDGDFFTIHYSTEKARVRCGSEITLQKALNENASRLGYDQSRAVTWRDSKGVVAAAQVGQPNVAYTASVSLETKG